MARNYGKEGDEALAQAFKDLMSIAISMRDEGTPVSHVKQAPTFTYLMTPKQFSRIRKICMENGWSVPNLCGIQIDLETVSHPLESRAKKNNCSDEEVLSILIAAYSPYSQVGMNRPKNAQGIFFNTGRKVQVGKTKYVAVAIMKVDVEGKKVRLAPVTAYHATDAKIRGIS